MNIVQDTLRRTQQRAISRSKTKKEIQPLINQWFNEQKKLPLNERQVPRIPIWYDAMFDSEKDFDLYLEKYFDLHYFQTGHIYMLVLE